LVVLQGRDHEFEKIEFLFQIRDCVAFLRRLVLNVADDVVDANLFGDQHIVSVNFEKVECNVHSVDLNRIVEGVGNDLFERVFLRNTPNIRRLVELRA
jgi:hypothetical protein